MQLNRTRQRWMASLLLMLVVLGGSAAWLLVARGAAHTVRWQYKGYNLPVWSEQGLLGSGPALQQLADTGANSVTLVVTWYTPDVRSSELHRTSSTASDESLIWAMDRAQELGLQVTLKPHVDSEDGKWRAYIDPADPDSWFRNYGALLGHYADLGREHGADGLIIGTELVSLSTNPAHEGRWRALIADMRQRFDGMLTYGANWGGEGTVEEFTAVPFWDALDYLGISAYFKLTEQTAPTLDELKASWQRWQTTIIAPFQRRWDKPVLFVEIGYRSAQGAAYQPWNPSGDLPLDTAAQVQAYEALFQSWAAVPWFAGSMFWSWSANPSVSPADTGYEVQSKPAFAVVHSWFGGTATTPLPPTIKIYSPASNGRYSGTVTVQAVALNVAQVSYQLDGAPAVPMRYDAATQMWEAPLDTRQLPAGKHHISVVGSSSDSVRVEDRAWNVEVAN